MKTPDIESIHQMTPLQHGMVFHSALHPDAGFYLEQVTFGVGVAIDPDLLRRSLNFVAGRHQCLRSGFFWENVKSPVQVIYRNVSIPVDHLDLSGETAEGQRRQFEQFLKEDRNRPFDLRRAPLFRAMVLPMSRNATQLVFTFHHAILDGWSLNRLFREIWDIYRGLEAGQLPNLPAAPQYSTFLDWLGQRDVNEARHYWTKSLAGIHGPVPLPILNDPDPGGGQAVSHVLQEISEDLSAKLKQVSRAHRVTLNELFQTAWAILLGQLSGEKDVVFGTIVSGRPPDLDGVEDIIGLFINTVPVRVTLEPDGRASGLLHEMHKLTAARRENEYCALTEIQDWSDVPNGTPMFETLFIFENIPGATKAGTGQAFAFERTNYPLVLLVAPAERISLKILYEQARMSQNAARVVTAQFISVLEQIAADPLRQVGGILPEVPSTLPAKTVPDTKTAPGTLDLLWRSRVKATPDAICLIDGDTKVSVAALNAMASGMAETLAHSGVKRGDIIAIRNVEGAELVAAMLAVLLSGAAFLLVDAAYPEAQQTAMLEQSRARYLIGEAPDKASLPVITPSEDAQAVTEPVFADAGLVPDDAAFVVFTSGSSGAPKGVVQTHRALANRLTWGWKSHPYSEGDRVIQKTPLGFVDCIAEILSPILGGATLVTVTDDIRRSPARLCDTMVDHQITRMTAVPSLLTAIVDHLDAADHTLADLRIVHASGEALPRDLLTRFAKRLPDVTLFNLYGSSEVAADVTTHRCDFQTGNNSVPIGAEIDNIEILLLGPTLGPVPVGAIGEIFVTGAGLARGYLDRPGETARRFLPDIRHPGVRMFRTGDLAWRRYDGTLVFAGRVDNQINLRGIRIEPEQIEAACTTEGAVAAAVAFVAQDGALVLAVEPRPDTDVDHKQLRQTLSMHLPRHMLPDRIVDVGSLPHLPNGKIDRAAIKDVAPQIRPHPESQSASPSTEAERTLAAIWSELLRVPTPSRHDNFFALGGHSVLAMQLASRVLKQTGMRLGLNLIFESPTLADMAAVLSAGHPAVSKSATRIRKAKPKLARLEAQGRK